MCALRLKKFDAKCVISREKWNRVVSVDAQTEHNVRVKEIILLVNYERRWDLVQKLIGLSV